MRLSIMRIHHLRLSLKVLTRQFGVLFTNTTVLMMKTDPWSYKFPDGTIGCVMAYNKAHAISTIMELHPDQLIETLSLFKEDMWTLNQH